MSQFEIRTDRVRAAAEEIASIARKLQSEGNQVNSVQSRLRLNANGSEQVRQHLKNLANTVFAESRYAGSLSTTLRSIADQYQNTEKGIAGSASSGGRNSSGSTGPGSGHGGQAGGPKGGSTRSSRYSADPVNLSTGNFIYEHTDLTVEGEEPFVFHRFYNSSDSEAGMLGRGWTHNYAIRLKKETGGAVVRFEDSREEHFRTENHQLYHPSRERCSLLTRKDDGTFCCLTTAGIQYFFDSEGRFIRRQDRGSFAFTVSYNEQGSPDRIWKDTGEFFAFSYDKDGFLSSVTDHDGRSVSFCVKDALLESVKTADEGFYRFRYDRNGLLTSVTNPRNIQTVINVYDEYGRTESQKFPDGSGMSFAYDDAGQAVVMTERNGSQSVHYHDGQYRNTSNVYPNGEEIYTYNEGDMRTSITDRAGNTSRLSYDNRGNLTGIITPEGTRISMTYETHNQPVAITVNGKTIQDFTYDRKGNLIGTSDALNRKTEMIYDAKSRPTVIVNPDGSKSTAEYDERGNIIRLTEPTGAETLYEYDSLNRVVRTVDAAGNETCLHYDTCGRITEEVNAEGSSRRYTYDENGNITSITDFDGSVSHREYNSLDRLSRVIDAEGRVTEYFYDSMWNVSRVVQPDGSAMEFLYDENNQLACEIDALGHKTFYTYDPNGALLETRDESGIRGSMEYDSLGRMVRYVNPAGAATEYKYDLMGNLVSVADSLGNEVTLSYDAAGQLLEEKGLHGEIRKYSYTPMGDVASVTDEIGRTTRIRYLPGGKKPVQVWYPDGTTEKYTYDLLGNVRSYTSPEGDTENYVYDSLNRVTKIYGEDGIRRRFSYDAMGNLVSAWNSLGEETTYTYTLSGKLCSVTDAAGTTALYTYDSMDRMTEMLISGGGKSHRTFWKYDLLGRLLSSTDAEGKTELYGYDVRGNMTAHTDPAGQKTLFEYTGQGDISHIRYADGREVFFSYNPLRHLEEIRDWTGITRIKNDTFGRAVQVVDPDGRILSYRYGVSGERTGMTYPDGSEVTYEYDHYLRLAAMTGKAAGSPNASGDFRISYGYDSFGRVSSRTYQGPEGDSAALLAAFNANGAVTSLVHQTAAGILGTWSFRYDSEGRRIERTVERTNLPEQNGIYQYQYDPAGRLTQVLKDRQLLHSYRYDAFGNRTFMEDAAPLPGRPTAVSFHYNALNQLVQSQEILSDGQKADRSYQYDVRGNLTRILRGESTEHSYSYDTSGSLLSAEAGDGSRAFYEYNGLGFRVGETRSSGGSAGRVKYLRDITRNHWDLLQKEENGSRQSYFWDGTPSALFDHNGDGSRLSFLLPDELGSPVSLLSGTGVLRQSYAYDEFGRELLPGQASLQPFGFTRHTYDPIAGSYFAQAREYYPGQGRFGGRDRVKGTADDPVTLNPYHYCYSDPVNYLDPDGNFAILATIAICAAIGAGASAGINAVTQYREIKRGNQEKFKWGSFLGATVEGAIVGGATGGGVGVLGAAVAGGVGACANSLISQGIDNKKINGWKVAEDTVVGAVVGGVFKAIGGDAIVNKTVDKFLSPLKETLVKKLGDTAGGLLAKKIAELGLSLFGAKSLKSVVKTILKKILPWDEGKFIDNPLKGLERGVVGLMEVLENIFMVPVVKGQTACPA